MTRRSPLIIAYLACAARAPFMPHAPTEDITRLYNNVIEILTLPYWALRVLLADITPAKDVRVLRKKTRGGRVYRAYMPRGERRGTAVCFLHGGGWRVGWPAIFAFYGKRLAREGFCAVLPAYARLRGEYLRMEEDAAAALDAAAPLFFEERTPRWALAGVSAGGQMAVSMALRRGAARGTVEGAAAVGAPMRFDRREHPVLRALLDNLFPCGAHTDANEPCRLIRGAAAIPPILLLHGEDDPWVSYAGSDMEHDGVTRIGVRARHTNCIARVLLKKSPESATLLDFLKSLG